MRRVVITGMGAVTCLGLGKEALWKGLIEGRSGVSRIEKFDPTGLRNEEAGEIKDEVLTDAPLPDDDIDEATLFAYLASKEAIEDGWLYDLPDAERLRFGLVFSTNFGGASRWEEFASQFLTISHQPSALSCQPSAIRHQLFTNFCFDFAASYVAEKFSLLGPSLTLSNACSSGTSAIGAAADLIRSGAADLMLAGGHEMLALSHLAGLSILRTITAEKCRPFDKNRSGTIFGEGAGILVLEELEHARRRGAQIYAEVLGYGLNSNAYHLTAPDKGGQGMIRVLKMALDEAKVDPSEVDYVNAHGTGTQYHDPEEVNAVKTVLGSRAYEIPMSSIKAATGHTMGAAGAVEAIATVLAMRDGIVPPTLNYETPDPECDLNHVPNAAQECKVNCAISISAGIGGNNSAIVLKKDAPQRR